MNVNISKSELREFRALDAEIAPFVFPHSRIEHSTNGVEPEVYVDGYGFFHPTTDPAAAFEVLKKCAEKDAPQSIATCKEGELWKVFYGGRYHEAQSDTTLELAICRFAKALFSK